MTCNDDCTLLILMRMKDVDITLTVRCALSGQLFTCLFCAPLATCRSHESVQSGGTLSPRRSTKCIQFGGSPLFALMCGIFFVQLK
jgi:hypothetical protein